MTSTNKDEALASYKETVSYLDKMSMKGVIHANNAARKKHSYSPHKRSLGLCLRSNPKLC